MTFAACAAKAMLGKDGLMKLNVWSKALSVGVAGKPCLLHSCGGIRVAGK